MYVRSIYQRSSVCKILCQCTLSKPYKQYMYMYIIHIHCLLIILLYCSSSVNIYTTHQSDSTTNTVWMILMVDLEWEGLLIRDYEWTLVLNLHIIRCLSLGCYDIPGT